MKLLLLLLPMFVFSQKAIKCPSFIPEKEFVTSQNQVEVKPRIYYLPNASEECVKIKVSFKCNKRQFAKITFADVNRMIVYANLETMTSMKNKYSYLPRRIDITFTERYSKWIVAIDYTAENDFGGNRNGLAQIQFTEIGEYDDKQFN